MTMDLETARALRARQAAEWDQQQPDFQNWRPTPTRAEHQAKADSNDLILYKEWDGSPIDPRAIDPLFDLSELPPPPPEIPVIFGTPQVGCELHVLPGLVTPRRIFQWTRDGASIVGANTLRYVLTREDIGARISFRATRAHQVARAREIGPVVRPGQ
jgi:hypothetical protein